MVFGGYLQSSREPCIVKDYGRNNLFKRLEPRGHINVLTLSLSSHLSRQDYWTLHVSNRIKRQTYHVPLRQRTLNCKSLFAFPSSPDGNIALKTAALALTRSYNALQRSTPLYQLVPAIGVIAFALWGLGPVMRLSRKLFFHRNDNNWRKSRTHYIFTSYLQPLVLWSGATLICRALDPFIMPSQASQAVKQRLLNFVRSLSSVMAIAFCLSSLIQQAQSYFMETNDSNDAGNMGFQFASKAVYTAVWVAAVSLFVELLGFSTQKWLTAGGLGTVLLTLAGREIFTNFLSSAMIHATRPFVLNEWIQTKIEGYEVSGTVEHVGWWSPTIIRGDDREAVHIPNHKFTVSVVRNLSQKTHWRIKTHLAISHLDVDKINNIVADMRKVLAKNPQVEQQKLHRRVFLDNVDPENQALLILVSCFVKTSHFEEYLCVKEAVLLDLLRIIRHHRARLATPIRTVEKMYGDGEVENIPFSETIFSRAGAAESRPLLLIEHPTKINGEEGSKARQAAHANEEQAAKVATADLKSTSSIPEEALNLNSDKQLPHQKAGSGGGHLDSNGFSEESSGEKQQKDIMTGDAYAKSSKTDPALSPPVSSNSDARRTDGGSDAVSLQTKPESERLQAPPSPATTSRTILEDNIVLGVALDGAKRILPIEEGMGPSSGLMDSKELASLRSASGAGSPTSSKEKKDSPNSAPGGSTADQRDQEG